MEAQAEVDRVWQDQDEWLRRSIRNTAGTGMFSSDRSIHQYAKEIWNAKVLQYINILEKKKKKTKKLIFVFTANPRSSVGQEIVLIVLAVKLLNIYYDIK